MKTNRPLLGPEGEIDEEVRRWAHDLAKRGKMPDTTKFVIEEARCVRATDKALLIFDEEEQEEIWVPKSVVHDDSEVYDKGHKGKFIAQGWWAKKQGYDVED